MSQKARWGITVLLVGIVGVVSYSLRPVCVPIPDEDMKYYVGSIEQRTDRDFYLKVFQKRDGRWYQCKTALSRAFFF